MTTTFTPSEAIKIGWETMKKHFWFFVGLLMLSWLIEIILTGIANAVKSKALFFYFVLIIAAWIIQMIVKMGLIKIALDIYDKGTAKMSDLFSCVDKLGKFVIGSLLYGLIVAGGIILFIIPGIIWAIKYQFIIYLIVDKNLSPMEALKKSGEITSENKGKLFWLSVLLVLINIAGAICLLVGLFATIPLTMVTTAYVYRKLMGEVAEIADDAQAPINTTSRAVEQAI